MLLLETAVTRQLGIHAIEPAGEIVRRFRAAAEASESEAAVLR